MKVAVVGAGIAGLSAARELNKLGHQAVILEKSRALGGRVATRWNGDYRFDTGASSFAPRPGTELESVMLQELSTEDLVKIEKPIFTHVNLRVQPGDPTKSSVPRYTYRSGNNTLAKLLAKGLEIRTETEVDNIKEEGDRYHLAGEDFEAVVLTSPVPQAAQLLWTLGENRATGNVRYRPCLSLLLGFEKEMDPGIPYHALIDTEQRHPLLWVSIESIKSPGRAAPGHTAMVVQMSGAYSLAKYAAPEREVTSAVLDYLERLFGKDWRDPAVVDLKRWKYSQPESVGSLESANRQGSRVILASDGLVGGRVEFAYDAGLWAARRLNETA